MNITSIWDLHDFFFALLWGLLAAGLRHMPRLLAEIYPTPSKNDAKLIKLGNIIFKMASVLAMAVAVGTIALPLLDALIAALLGTAFALFNKYGGLALLIGAGVICYKNCHPKQPEAIKSEDDSVNIEYAKQEAAELHEDLGELVYNASLATSENTPINRPRDAFSIETGRETPYRMDGTMAIHQFTVDLSAPITKPVEDLILQELQRHINQQSKRYKHLCPDGRGPVIVDVKNSGNFITVEVVLYHERHKQKIEACRRARIDRQQNTGDSYDRDF